MGSIDAPEWLKKKMKDDISSKKEVGNNLNSIPAPDFIKKKGDGTELPTIILDKSELETPSTSVPDLPLFMQKSGVDENVSKLRNNIRQGNVIDPSLVSFVRQYAPEQYSEIAKEILPVKTDKYVQSNAAFNNLIGTLNDRHTANKFLSDYKKETGRDYAPEDVPNLKATQRIKLGIGLPGDQEQATTELIQEDLEINFPIKQSNIFDPASKSIEEQVKSYNEIMTDPEKKTEYLLRRQKQEIEKENRLRPYEDRFSSESMNLGDDMKDVSLDNPEAMKNYLQQRSEKLVELNTLRQKVDNMKKIAANIIAPVEMDRLVKEAGIDDVNSQDAVDYLQTKEAREKLGLRVALKSDARLSAHLADIESSLQQSSNFFQALSGKGENPNRFVEYTPIKTDEDSRFKNLSETGDEKIQAQLRIKGYNDMVNSYQKSGNISAIQQLLNKQSEVAVENGKAVSDELFARLSSARFKDNDNSTTIGTFDITPENMRKWAVESGFTPVEMSILEQYMIPDEQSRSITSNLQTSGFVDNLLEAVGNTAVNIKNIFRTDAARTRELLNENTGRKEDIGQYTPFLQELKIISEKEKQGTLTPLEQSRKELLLENTNLLNWWQQLKSGTGDLTGQVLGIAISAKGLDKLFKLGALGRATQQVAKIETAAGEFETASTNIANNISNSPSFLQNVAKYAKDNQTLYVSSYTNAYDGYKKESLQLMPGTENEGKRLLYANMMSGFEAVSETIFNDRKVLGALGKEIRPVVKEIVQDISTNSLDKVAALGKLNNILLGGDYKKFVGNFLLSANQEASEEAIVDIVGDLSKAIVLEQDYNFMNSASGAFKTYYTMLMNGALVAGMAAKSDTRNNTFNKSSLYNIASSPVDYKDEVNRLLLNGEINQQQANNKISIINTAEQAYASMVNDGVVDKTGKNDAKNATYLLHVVNELVNKQKADKSTDEVAKSDLQKQAERSRKIRESIYIGLVSVDEFLNPVTQDEKVAEDLGIQQVNKVFLEETEAAGVSGSALKDVGDVEYNDFIDKGKVSEERLNDIAEKVKTQQPLSDREKEIFTDKTAEINKIISKAPTQYTEAAGKAVKEVHSNNSELSKIGTEQEYAEYLKTIFPDSQVKDIMYHRSNAEFDKFDNSKLNKETGGLFDFTKESGIERYGKNEYPVLLNIKKIGKGFELKDGQDGVKSTEMLPNGKEVYSVPDASQIHILGSKSDIEGFKKWKESKSKSESTEAAGVSGSALKDDPDLKNIDPTIIAARSGDKQAQKKLEEYGLDWEQTTTYRFVGQSEVDVLLSNNKVESKRGMADAGIDVTTSPKVTSAASNEYRVTFKESFDVNNGLGKVKSKSKEEGDHHLEKGRGYDINDVAKIEKIDEKGNVVETIYESAPTQYTEAATPKEQAPKPIVNEETKAAEVVNPKKEGSITEAKPDKAVPKTGKYEEKARKIADKIKEAELPSWLKIDDANAKKSGVGADEIKKPLANATIKMGQLLDKGVEFADAVKEAVKELVELLGEDKREVIEKGFSEEYEATLNNLSGIRKALVSDEIIAGVDLERIGDKEMMALGRKILDTGEVKPEALVTKIITEKTGVLTPTEVVGLITYKRDIDTQLQDTYKQINDKRAAGEDIGTLGVEAANLERQVSDFDVMAVITAQQQSMAFRLRQRMLDRDYNVVTQIEKYKKNNGGVIPPEVEAKFRDLDRQLKEVKAQLAEAERKAADKESQESVDNIKESVGREKVYTDEELDKKIQEGVETEIAKLYEELPAEKKSAADKAISALEKFRAKIKTKTYDATLGIPAAIVDLGAATAIRAIKVGKTVSEAVRIGIKRIKDALKEKGIDTWDGEEAFTKDMTEFLEAEGVSTKKKPKDKPTINEDGTVSIPNEMLRDLVRRGVTDINDLTDAVHEQVVKDLPDVSKRQIRDYITDYGKQVNPTADELQTQVNTAKRIGRLLSELEDVQNSIKKASGNKTKLTDKERELKRQINSLSKDVFGKEEKSDEQKLSDAKERVKSRMAELERKIKNKDFAKPVKKIAPTDEELVRLNNEKEKLQEQFDDAQYKLELKNRTFWQKAEDVALELTSGLVRGLVASIDLSAGFVQGFYRIFSDIGQAGYQLLTGKKVTPIKSWNAFGNMFKHLISEKASEEFLTKLKSTPAYNLMQASKLAIDDKTGKISAKEGLFISNWINLLWDKIISPVLGIGTKQGTQFIRKLNPYAASQRAFDGYVNSVRVQSFIQMAKELEKDGYTFESDPKVFQKAADFVNTTTGRGSLGAADASSKWLNIIMFAPRKVISEMKLFTPYAFVYYARMPKAVRKKALLNFAQFAITYFGINALMWAARAKDDDDDDNFWNMNSSDFLTHKIGDQRVNIGGGMKSALVFMSRLWSGEFTDQYGKTTKLGERYGKQVNTRLDLIWRFALGKASPALGVASKKLDERKGLEVDDADLVKDLTVPIWMQDVNELYKEQPKTMGAFLTVLSIFGANVRTVDESTRKEDTFKIYSKEQTGAEGVRNATPEEYKMVIEETEKLTEEKIKAIGERGTVWLNKYGEITIDADEKTENEKTVDELSEDELKDLKSRLKEQARREVKNKVTF